MIVENDIPKPRKPRTPKPVTNNDLAPKKGLGAAVTRKRRIASEQLAADKARRRTEEHAAARAEMDRLRKEKNRQDATANDRWHSSLLQTVVSNQTALLRSWGFRQPVQSGVSSLHNVEAYTDWKRIVVRWPENKMPDRSDRTATLDTIAQIKGVMQHEMGHLRFTTAWPNVLNEAKIKGSHTEPALHRTWNLLEDQRMEMLVIKEVPRIATYFTTMVSNVVLNGAQNVDQSWLLLAGRQYLPVEVRHQSALLFDEFTINKGVANGAITWLELVSNYCKASTHQQILDAVVAAFEFIADLQVGVPNTSTHSDDWSSSSANPSDTASDDLDTDVLSSILRKPQEGKGKEQESKDSKGGSTGDDKSEGDDKADDDASAGSGEGDDEDGESRSAGGDKGAKSEGDDDGDTTGAADGQGDTDSPQHSNEQGKGVSTGNSQPTYDQLLDDINKLSNEAVQRMRQDFDVQEMCNDAVQNATGEGLPEFSGVPLPMSDAQVAEAGFVAAGIERALNTFVTQCQPVWHNRQETGFIDALAYRTKGVGDRNFRRELDDRGSTGLDVHVSMLCDMSTSMAGNPMVALSKAMYAVALGCQRVGVSTTFTLWSSMGANYRVWSDGNYTPDLWPATGGTDPIAALDDLDHHNTNGASKHLVLVFTDGEWSNAFPGLQRWSNPSRRIVLVKYGCGYNQSTLGADSMVQINAVEQLPDALTNALVDVLSTMD